MLHDIDGVIHLGNKTCGIRPGPSDVIITGRSYEEEEETLAFLRKNGINNVVFFNQVQYEEKSRESSGWHKGQTILLLHRAGLEIEYFFEDDEVRLVNNNYNEEEKDVDFHGLSLKRVEDPEENWANRNGRVYDVYSGYNCVQSKAYYTI